MAKPDATKWPNLKKAWDDYGHMISWDQLFDMKVRGGYEAPGSYVVVAWKEEDGAIGIADLAGTGYDAGWEMQNDGFDPLTASEWKKLRIVPDCDWFEIPGKDD